MFSIRQLCILIILLTGTSAKKHRSVHVRPHRSCSDPPNLKEQLAEWMRESMEGASPDQVEDDWNPPVEEPPICERSPKAEGETTVMQRALCPWSTRVNFDDTREPKILSESFCLCRRSRGASGAFCLPITQEVPVLRRASCDPTSGHWQYIKSKETITIGCHSVLPRTQRATPLSKHYRLSQDLVL
ncbi:unnamed protein product [Auanema sp. JU1783]|nr:unnamed protein product [Auanema sp. JU1783]